MDDREKRINQLGTIFETLSNKKQEMIIWLASHIQFLDLIDEGKILEENEINTWTKKAAKENDITLLAMVQYKRLKDENRIQKQKIPLDRG